ncbi:hypothetical protein BV898_08624 [Hypsibius exemplaris]|uniref:Tudor domain-containing protein n=1 Tax=Hypsibius exemplaris TaxID=2072580 RepID=A0A1W0WPT6_HYPEX|nr:hypothetical protein BV898_08624 [Hypsibius exemplaris]
MSSTRAAPFTWGRKGKSGPKVATSAATPTATPKSMAAASAIVPPAPLTKAAVPVRFGRVNVAAASAKVVVTPPPPPSVPLPPYERNPWKAPKTPNSTASFFAGISFLENDGTFYLRPLEVGEALASLSTKWQSDFAACENLHVSQLKYGAPCIVKYAKDECWYRATFLGIRDNKRHVFYEDFGTVEPIADDKHYKAIGDACRDAYEHPTCLFSCRLVHPMNNLEFADLSASASDLDLARRIIAGTTVLVDVIGYRPERRHGKERVFLLVDIFIDGVDRRISLLDRLMERNPKVAFKPAFPQGVSFDLTPTERECAILQFPPAHVPPFGEKILVKLVDIKDQEAVLLFVPMPEARDSNVSSTARVIYSDASILASLEEEWTKGVGGELKPAALVNQGNSYLIRHERSVCRVEVSEVLGDLDAEYQARDVAVVLVDRGLQMNLPARELLTLPAVVSVCVAKQTLWADVCLTGNSQVQRGGRQALDEDFEPLDSMAVIMSYVGEEVFAEFSAGKGEPGKLTVCFFVQQAASATIDWAA